LLETIYLTTQHQIPHVFTLVINLNSWQQCDMPILMAHPTTTQPLRGKFLTYCQREWSFYTITPAQCTIVTSERLFCLCTICIPFSQWLLWTMNKQEVS
jgi:hypothetical protein